MSAAVSRKVVGMKELTHFTPDGATHMVDVGDKPVTDRLARAETTVLMQPETLRIIRQRGIEKGDVLEVARLAGIMATKRTDELIPLCHSLGLDSAGISYDFPTESAVRIVSTVKVKGRTGVEMEALTAVSVAALTIYDMCKAIDREITISNTRLLEKSGGRSGHFKRTEDS